MDFEWDRKKAADNTKKHNGITFEDASLAFLTNGRSRNMMMLIQI